MRCRLLHTHEEIYVCTHKRHTHHLYTEHVVLVFLDLFRNCYVRNTWRLHEKFQHDAVRAVFWQQRERERERVCVWKRKIGRYQDFISKKRYFFFLKKSLLFTLVTSSHSEDSAAVDDFLRASLSLLLCAWKASEIMSPNVPTCAPVTSPFGGNHVSL